MREQLEQVLENWSCGVVVDIAADALGTINQSWLVKLETGRYVIRLSVHRDSEKLQRECSLMAYVNGKGIAAILPVETKSGGQFVENDVGLWTLTAFAPGRQTSRDVMSPAQDRGLGRYLAVLLRCLSECPLSLARTRSLDVDTERTLAAIGEYERVIRGWTNVTVEEAYALDRLAGRRQWIDDHPDESTSGLTNLSKQVIHGDYQEKNVFFGEDGDVVALIDWDNAWIAPREWEIIRTLNFVMLFDPARGRMFVEGYLEVDSLDLDTLDSAAWAYGVSRTHSLWLFEEIYGRGNDRGRRFLKPGPFQPVYDRWIPLRDALATLM